MYGSEIKAHRTTAKLSQIELSKKTGIPQQTISAWENDTNTPSIEQCAILADFYEITIDELIGREAKKNYK